MIIIGKKWRIGYILLFPEYIIHKIWLWITWLHIWNFNWAGLYMASLKYFDTQSQRILILFCAIIWNQILALHVWFDNINSYNEILTLYNGRWMFLTSTNIFLVFSLGQRLALHPTYVYSLQWVCNVHVRAYEYIHRMHQTNF